MSVFFTPGAPVELPRSYRDLTGELWLRVVDTSITPVPGFAHSVGVGDEVAAHYFCKAVYHLDDPCEECGRP